MKMDDLTNKEWSNAPYIIKHLYIAGHHKTPISRNLFEKAINEHPEYFTEEIERRRKWASIPQSVHDEYDLEFNAHFREMPKTRGILSMLDFNSEKSKKEIEDLKIWWSKGDKIYNKHYSGYGFTREVSND